MDNFNIKEAKNKINLVDYIAKTIPTSKIKNLGGGTYSLEPCPICNHKGHFRINAKENYYNSFNGCCKGGDIINFMQEVENLSEEQAINKLKELVGADTKELKAIEHQVKEVVKTNVKQYVNQVKSLEEASKIQKVIMENIANTRDNKELVKTMNDYLQLRKLDKSLADKYGMFLLEDNSIKEDIKYRLCIPILEKIDNKIQYSAYIGRNMNIKTNDRYKNSKGIIPLFNNTYLTDNIQSEIYITEGIFDCLTLEDVGLKAISLNGVNQKNKLKALILENIDKLQNTCFIIATDSDSAGIECRKDLESFFIENKLKNKYIKFEDIVESDFKDIIKDINGIRNYSYPSDKEAFKEAIISSLTDRYKDKSLQNYLADNYLNKIKEEATRTKINTSFNKFDLFLKGIRSGLYCLGAISSLGKTTFCINIANNLARSGHKVIFFSLEQSKFELVNKSISRITHINSKGNARTVDSIINNAYIEEDVAFMKAYSEFIGYSGNLIIEETNFSMTVDSISKYIKDYMAINQEKPIIFIDYLQIIQPKNDKTSDKQNIDYIVTSLKRLSREYDIPIFVISSFNRDSYNKKASFGSLKESGGIEYSSDVVLALQLSAVNEHENDSEALTNAKKQANRDVELVCLKNRFGSIGWTIPFTFYAPFNNFEEK